MFHRLLLGCFLIGSIVPQCSGFMPSKNIFGVTTARKPCSSLQSTYSVDQSDYSPKDSDYEKDDDWNAKNMLNGGGGGGDDDDSVNAEELKPVPMSKNSGNRFVAILWDRLLDQEDRTLNALHEKRIEHTEDHVMHCRKSNLYNETFNQDSMVDVLWSRQLLSSDLQRVIGQAICMESPELPHVQEFLRNEPLVNFFTGGDLSEIPLFRWRHIRDYTLRQDDGRFGSPCMILAFDADAEDGTGELRAQTNETHLEYLIQSERVIATGPLHLCTEIKDDPSSLAVGDLIMFNAADREEAIKFAEAAPRAQQGLYKTVQAHFYNNLDVTGKFVGVNPMEQDPTADMKEPM